jgi:Domain of unknown function (DUF4126)
LLQKFALPKKIGNVKVEWFLNIIRPMETFLSVCVGLGLAAACGFRVFVPLLALSVASFTGHVPLAPAFQWIGSGPALIAFSVATVLEIAGYYIPWVDHVLDSLATPAAVVAGTVITASMITQMSPFLHWTLALIAGGGIAGLVQTGTVVTRAASTSASGGLANPVVASVELGLSGLLSFLALALPVTAAVLVLSVLGFVGYRLYKRFGSKKQTA